MSSPVSDLMYALQEVPGKGKGLVATRKIPRGTRILCEEPIVRMPEIVLDSQTLLASIRRQVDALTPDQRRAFFSMHNIHADDAASRHLGIFRTNALPFGDDIREAGIFLDACRINHACDNNGQKSWNENIKRHTVHALRDIEKGQEITIYYLGVLKSREARQEALRRKFAFTCSCRLCSLPPDQSQESDRRLDEILKLDGLIGRDGLMGIVSAPLQILRHVDQQIRLYNEQGPDDNGLPRAFLDAAQIAIANGDLARARIFVERAVLGWIVLEGDDSSKVLEYRALIQDPSKHELYGMSMKWKTAVDDIPLGLASKEFDDWLWKREKPKRPGQPVDFRNRATFPGFIDLPDENDVSPEFYSSIDGFTYRPRRHWLFLAEIVDVGTLLRLQMEIKDVDGMTVPLFFYTHGRGSELGPSQVQKGYTIAILYAQRHTFMFSKPGIRHEEPTNIKIFQLPLNKLLALSDRLQKFSTEMNGTRTCHGCDRQAASLKKCAKCSLFWYCNGACQSTGWNEKDHKADCRLLKDSDLKGLFSLNWDNFEGHVGFPLNTSGSLVDAAMAQPPRTTDTTLQEHQRDSSLHLRIDTVEGSNEIKYPCGKTAMGENGLREYTRDSPGHHKLEEFCAPAGTGRKVGHIPEESGREKPADGLREKEKLPEARQYANFRNEETFPAFVGLPRDDDMNVTFYSTVDGFNPMPRKHWCFLAEIISIEQLIRVKLIVRDKAGTTVPVDFHTDRGIEFPPTQLQSGYTIAILYAHQHGFLDFTIGIHQEEYCAVKVIPAALDELLQLSDRVHQYSMELDGKRTCHGCDEKKISLQKCGKCSLFWYCNKPCQATGWNDRGHKRDCKLIRDSDLQAMFLLEWGHFKDFIRFPLHDTITTRGEEKMGYIDAWKHQVEEVFQSKPATEREVALWKVDEAGPATCGYNFSAGAEAETSSRAEEAQRSNKHINHSLGEDGGCTTGSPSILEELLKDIDFDSTTDAEQMRPLEGLKKGPLEEEAEERECKLTNVDQKENELEGIQKRIERQREAAREKAAARAKEAMLKMTSFAKLSSGSTENSPDDHSKQERSQDAGTADDSAIVRRCLRSAIPSIAATTGTDILELINLDILNEHLGLNIDLSDAWQRLLKLEAASENIETFLGECATDPYAWSILRREGHFKLKLWGVIRAFEQNENRKNKNREYLIQILETLGEILENGVEWEIVSDRVPRAVIRMAIATAKEGPNPPGIDLGDEDFQIDPFWALIADKSESSLFGTPDSDNPRYFDFWMRREGFGSTSS